jgi:uncharacterized protein YjbJ (UPF0337 family)
LTEQEKTSGGLVGKVAGKVKEVAGSLSDKDDLAREGRLQEARADADLEAARRAEQAHERQEQADLVQEQKETELERARLENEVAAQRREQQIELDRQTSERAADVEAQRRQEAAEHERDRDQESAAGVEQRAEQERLATAKEEIRLEQQAREAEARADAIETEDER